jgi:beta-aspartyl-peptidase (threonine type)
MVEAHLSGVRNASAAGWRVLERDGSALDAVEEAVVVLEDDETFDAGRGSFLNRDGKVQLDAFIMDGATLRGGGVGCVERLRNPVRAARKILSDSPHVYFVAEGAERFAAEHGIALCRNEDLVIPREVERLREYQAQASTNGNDLFAPAISHDMLSHDTVGAVALDRDGNIAASTSTGGTLNKAPGRLGDSSLIGCGCYADNLSAAASTTGWGEPIMKLVLAKWAADRVESGSLPEWAAKEAMNYLKPTTLPAWRGRCTLCISRKRESSDLPSRRTREPAWKRSNGAIISVMRFGIGSRGAFRTTCCSRPSLSSIL